jgi:hypothetical protein
MIYRPWGNINWVLSLSSSQNWHFVGAIGTTERCLSSWALLKTMVALSSENMAQIHDVDSEKHRDATEQGLRARREEFLRGGGAERAILNFDLMAELFRILHFASDCAAVSPSVVLDITALPKRFFFPMLRFFVQSNNIKNLLITYTSPANYTDEPLYEDIEPWRALPGFTGTMGRDEHWIVSVGFLVESLRQYLGDNPEHERMKLLIPFPAALAILRRTWESVAKLEGGQLECGNPRFEKLRVDPLDMSSAFDRIVSLARGTQKVTAFAPFGPKPTSAAMCLFASAKGSPVYYPQPTVYHPSYAMGIRENDPEKAVTAYWVKHDGQNLYTV